MNQNHEGYRDPTADAAVGRAYKQEKEKSLREKREAMLKDIVRRFMVNEDVREAKIRMAKEAKEKGFTARVTITFHDELTGRSYRR